MNVISETLSSFMPGDLVIFVYRRRGDGEFVLVGQTNDPQLDAADLESIKKPQTVNRIEPSAMSWLNEMMDFDRF